MKIQNGPIQTAEQSFQSTGTDSDRLRVQITPGHMTQVHEPATQGETLALHQKVGKQMHI